MRLTLRPGYHPMKRHDGQLQVGLDPRRAVVLPDTAGVRRCLEQLSQPVGPGAPADPATIAILVDADLLVDQNLLLPRIPVVARTEHGPDRYQVAALASDLGDEMVAADDRRSRCHVDVLPFGGALGQTLGDELSGLSRAAGLPPSRAGEAADLAAVVGIGEPHRDLLNDLIRCGTPHVIVRMSEGQTTVGPFVVPGQTACLRCLDAHYTDADPSWPLLVEQYASSSSGDRADGVPEPRDALIATIAVAWAVRDLATFAEGGLPSSWSTTIRLDPRLSSVESRAWLRHRDCGCSWGTMGT